MRLIFGILALGFLALPAQAQRKLTPQTFQTSAGEVKITAIYHATVMIEGGGKVIYIDPAKPANLTDLPKADLILITHEHGDHVDQDQTSIKAISKPETVIMAPASVAKFIPSVSILQNNEVKRFDPWVIDVIPAYNLKRGPAPGQFYHPKDSGNGYVLNYGGMRFYFSGDTEATPEMRALRGITVAYICMNLPYTMTAEEAADAVKAFKPKIVIPYHYRGMPPTDMDAFTQKLGDTNIEVRILNWYPTN